MRYVISIDPAVKTLALAVLDFESDKPDLIYRGGKAEVKFLVFTEVSKLTDLESMFNYLSNLIDFKETLLVYERFVIYGKHSMVLIEKVNQIIGVIKFLFEKLGGKPKNIKSVTYEKWSKEIGRRCGMKTPKYYRKNVRSKVLFEFLTYEAPKKLIQALDKSDHVLDAVMIGLSVRKPIEN